MTVDTWAPNLAGLIAIAILNVLVATAATRSFSALKEIRDSLRIIGDRVRDNENWQKNHLEITAIERAAIERLHADTRGETMRAIGHLQGEMNQVKLEWETDREALSRWRNDTLAQRLTGMAIDIELLKRGVARKAREQPDAEPS